MKNHSSVHWGIGRRRKKERGRIKKKKSINDIGQGKPSQAEGTRERKYKEKEIRNVDKWREMEWGKRGRTSEEIEERGNVRGSKDSDMTSKETGSE